MDHDRSAWTLESRRIGPERSGPPVRVRWLGTAGFEIDFDGTVVLIDPYLTRASLPSVVLGRLVPDVALLSRELPRADAIIAGHTHFDHVLDVPAIARATGARVFGSRSAIALCRAERVDEAQLVDVERSRPTTVEVGPFEIRFVPSAHSPFLFGRVPMPGDIVDCADVPMRAERYRCGAVFGVDLRVAGRRIYHVGSAEILDAGAAPLDVDLALLCVAGWPSTRHFPERVARALGPRAILLSHWDDFFRPFSRGAVSLPAMQTPRLVDRLRAVLGPDVPIGAVDIAESVLL